MPKNNWNHLLYFLLLSKKNDNHLPNQKLEEKRK